MDSSLSVTQIAAAFHRLCIVLNEKAYRIFTAKYLSHFTILNAKPT